MKGIIEVRFFMFLAEFAKERNWPAPLNLEIDSGMTGLALLRELAIPLERVEALMVNGKAIGILRVYSSEERDFTPDECDFMLGVANISAIAIENARMHEATRLNYELLTSYNYQVFED